MFVRRRPQSKKIVLRQAKTKERIRLALAVPPPITGTRFDMANMISNNNNPNSLVAGNNMPTVATTSRPNPNINAKVVGGVGGGGHSSVGGISNLREISDYLLPNGAMNLAPGQCPYDHIIEMIRGLDLEDDGITMNHKIKSIETDFCNIVRDENMLW